MMSDNEREISIVEILHIVWAHKWLIFVCAAVLGAAFFVKSAFLTEDSYTSTGMLYVSSQMSDMTSSAIDATEIEASRSMVSTCMELINSRTYLDYVSHMTGQKYTWEEIGGLVSMSSVNDTELLSISVTTDDPDDSYDIADTIIKKAPSQLGTIFTTSTIEIIDEADYPEGPNSKGIIKNTGIGILAGILLGGVIAFIIYMFDKKVHSTEELVDKFNLPVLGEIEC